MKRTPQPVPPAPPKQENPPFVPYDPATYAQDLAKVLRHIRTQIRHLSLHALARLSDVDRHHLREIESGAKHPTTFTRIKICNALRIDPSKIDAIAEASQKARR